MATTKAKNTKKSGAKKNITRISTSKVETVDTVEAKTTKNKIISKSKAKKVRFFGRKFDSSENILTIFKDTKILGALIGEAFGTAVITAVALTLGLYNPLYWIFGYTFVTLAVFKLSGANLNPAITIGMLATRRMSAIRGVLYIIAQIIGAWIGYMIISAFYNIGVASGNIDGSAVLLPSLEAAKDLTAATEDFSFFWPVTMIECLGVFIIAFCYARALNYKKNHLTAALTIAGGVFFAMIFAVLINQNFFYMNGNTFTFNPAISMMFGLFPGSAENFGELMNALWPMLVSYVVFPAAGGALGFYLSDLASYLKGDELAN
ncbi:aquaporin [Candidatus Saccharibacteria bacterium]|nr:aquaporin [Candidatus Saccharibacteria bacterium]